MPKLTKLSRVMLNKTRKSSLIHQAHFNLIQDPGGSVSHFVRQPHGPC